MKCPFCGDQESKVVDSRHSEDGLSIRRRRECLNCQRRFTTYVLLLLGYYNPIVSAINDFLEALTAFDMEGILTGVGILAPFGIGVVVGVLVIAKIIEIIFNKCPLYAYWAIIGLIVASPIAIIAMATIPAITVLNVVTGLVALCVGVFIAMKLGD